MSILLVITRNSNPTNMASQIDFDFKKKTMSLVIINFFRERIEEEYEKELFTKVVKGIKLKKDDANQLIHSLFQSMFMKTDEIQEEVEIPKEDTLEDDPTFTQMMKESVIHPKISAASNVQSTSAATIAADKEKNKVRAKDEQTKNICRFYRNGKCKFGEECRFEHPRICKKFRNSGSKRLNENGCDDKCNQFHPNACRDSLKNKSCPRPDCRFYHIRGTKVQKKEEHSTQHNKKRDADNDQGSQRQSVRTNFSTQNRFEALTDPMTPKHKESTQRHQVFHREEPALAVTLAQIMQELIEIRAFQLEQKKKERQPSSQMNWRKEQDSDQRWSTQEQHRAWDSPQNHRSSQRY